jgi:hypothetical protein
MAAEIESAATSRRDVHVGSEPDAVKRATRLILILAVALGAGLRFYRLGAEELSRGEAAAWTAAAAPDFRSVFLASNQLDPGKAGIYDLVLHLWIAAFGDAAGPMRSLSALLGTFAIVLIFFAVREIFLVFDDDRSAPIAWNAAGFAALLYACNWQMITIERTARMYPLMLVAVFGQLWAFTRAHRDRGAWVIVIAALCTDLAVAANFTSLFFFIAEAIWLAYLRFVIGVGIFVPKGAGELSLGRPAAALLLAAALFLPIGITDARIAMEVLHAGILGSIAPRPLWWPFHALKVMVGNAAFWPLLLLAAFGIWRMRGRGHATAFLLFWVIVPFALLELVSYGVTPLMVERYGLISMTGYLVLAAVGVACLPNVSLRYLVAALVVGQSLAHVHRHWRAPEDVQWREAAQFAVQAAPKNSSIAVMPPQEPLLVLKYYLPPSARQRLVSADAMLDSSRIWRMRCGTAPVLIASTELPAPSLAQAQVCYPQLLRRFRLVEVRGR